MAKTEVLTLHLVPYMHLSPEEKEVIHGWLNEHGVDHTTVPVGDQWTLDASTNEVRIPVLLRRDGKPYLDESGEPARAVIRRVARRPIPWRRADTIERWEKR